MLAKWPLVLMWLLAPGCCPACEGMVGMLAIAGEPIGPL